MEGLGTPKTLKNSGVFKVFAVVHFRYFGAFGDPPWAHLGSSWAPVGATNHTKTIGNTMFGDMTLKIDKTDACFTTLRPCCGHVGPSEAPSWAMMSKVGALLVSIWGHLGRMLAHLGS